MKPEEIYAEKKQYIEGPLADILKIYPTFEGLDYAVDTHMGEEFVRIKTETDGPTFINVTANSLAATLSEIARIILNQRPTGLITSPSTKKAIAPLFRKEATQNV